MGWWYHRRPLKTVKGGIKAHTKRGYFGESWWAKRWNQTLEEYDIGERLSRGRTYARKGQVESIKISKGSVTAIVHGSWTYEIEIAIKPVPVRQWDLITDRILSSPPTFARLLAGQMPDDIEDIFSELGLRLFPDGSEISTGCTCLDWANPCKHIVAVYLLLAEEFDRDPFLIFKLRGMERDEILRKAGFEQDSSKTTPKKKATAATMPMIPNPLVADPDTFWSSIDAQLVPDDSDAIIPESDATLPKKLGNFPFWRGAEEFMPSMEEIYRNASRVGSRVFLGDLPNDDEK